MSRVGWIVLAGILLVVGVLASLVRFGGPPSPRVQPVPLVATDSLIVPVAGIGRGQLTDTWGDARSAGRTHHGTDIMAPGGTPVVAAAPGTVVKLFQSKLGGITLYERSPDRRWTYYYAHLARYAPGVHEGQKVNPGDQLGSVGDTGDAGAGNYHLHFSLTRTDPAQHWWEGEDVNPYPYLSRGSPLP